ncbi:MAG TPA: response regulator [Vicinamibacterales bacterium]
MRVLIVDDEAPARRKLRRLLEAEDGVEIVGEASDGREAVEAIGTHEPDVVFLDIQMPVLDGFGVIEQIGVDNMPRVVFVTAYDEHALRAFEVQAVDYLLKPIAPQRFSQVIARLAREIARDAKPSAESASRLAAAVASGDAAPFLRRLLVHQGERARLLNVEAIDWIEADRNVLTLHAGAAVHTVRGTLSDLEARLDPAKFLRISRSAIVRLDAIDELQPWFHGDYRVILRDGTTLTWSRRYRARDRHAFEIGGGRGEPT